LYLEEKEIPEENRMIIQTTCEVFNLDVTLFQKLLDIKIQKTKPSETEIREDFKNYIKEVRKLSKIADDLGG
jgi:hypothetical protein